MVWFLRRYLSYHIGTLFKQINLGRDNNIALRDSDLNLVARYAVGKLYYPNEDKGLSTALVNAIKTSPIEGYYSVDASRYDGVSRDYYFSKNTKYGFLVNAGITHETAFADWRKQAWVVSGLVAAFSLAFLSLAWMIYRVWMRQEEDIVRIRAHEVELSRIANYDALTGLPNQHLLPDRIGQAVALARISNKLLAVCYLDLDDFKPINDLYGHDAGDNLLFALAERIKKTLRAGDTLARTGGDEFVLICSGFSHLEDVYAMLDRVLTEVRVPVLIEDNAISMTSSIGVTLFPEDNSNPDAMLRHADQAMYRAKEAGKDCYHLFDSEHEVKRHEHRQFIHRLREALKNEEFVLHYQPKVDFLSGGCYRC